MSLLRLLGFGRQDEPADTSSRLADAVRERLGHLPPERAELVAAFAGLLMRVAHADQDVSETEHDTLRRLVHEHAGLPEDEAEAVISLVTAHLASMAGIDYALLTRAMNEHGSADDKLHLIDCLYAMATADDLVSTVEEDQIRAVGHALMLPRSQLVEIRGRYREQLEVVQAARKLQQR